MRFQNQPQNLMHNMEDTNRNEADEITLLEEFYNEYITSLEYFDLIKPVLYEKDHKYYFGKIKSKVSLLDLLIDFIIPNNFPYNNIRFETDSIFGYPHLIPNNGSNKSWFCLNPSFSETPKNQLEQEFGRLNRWIITYLNNKEKDGHYDYPLGNRSNQYYLLFKEEPNDYSEERFKDNRSGIVIGEISPSCNNVVTTIMRIGDPVIGTSFHSTGGEGICLNWIFIDWEPINERGQLEIRLDEIVKLGIYSTEEMDKYLSLEDTYKQELEKQLEETENDENKGDISKLVTEINDRLVGYKIPSTQNSYEVQWELLNLSYSVTEGFFVNWNRTYNMVDKRYYGRGALCEKIQKSTILLIGAGAIGSSLASILARGGVKKVNIQDGDIVEPGNICRSVYNLQCVTKSKVDALRDIIWSISPYIKVKIHSDNFYLTHEAEVIEMYKKKLISVDVIFDCTGSNELFYFISQILDDNKYYNLSITNEARSMICISNIKGGPNMYELRRILLSTENDKDENLFYEGMGCYYPTFKASFCDINALLNLAVRKINKRIEDDKRIPSFILRYQEDDIKYDEILEYIQPELGITLSVPQSLIEEIHNNTINAYPYEVGGYIAGGYSRDGRNIVITHNVISEDQYGAPTTYRTCDMNDVHAQLNDLFEKSKGVIDYIGEWHSHPNMTTEYSHTDFSSIQKQAHSKEINTNNPLLMIASIGSGSFEICFRLFYENKLYEFKYLINSD